MQTGISGILDKIDVLVKMAGASLNIDTLHVELNEIEKESSKLKNELSLLTSGNIEDKYFKASEKQVDENIKVSLEAKIRKQVKSLQELQKQIATVSIDEEDMHNSLAKIKEEIIGTNEYIDTLKERIESITDSNSLKNYNTILDDQSKHLLELEETERTLEAEYANLLEKLNYLNLAKEEIEKKLESDKDRLQETKANLVNPSSYIDEDLKKIDDNRIVDVKKQIAVLDKRRIEIITDPAMIAEEAKSLIIDDDRTSALSKVKELVTLVKAKPYMDIPSGTELNSVLNDELEAASNRRDEFAALIDSKDYSCGDSRAISERINFLNIEIANLEDKIRLAKEEVKRIDANDFAMVAEKLTETIQIASELEQSIKEYQEIMENEDEKTPKRRAILSSAFQKKQKDLDTIYGIIENYKKDQQALIKRAYTIEAKEIASYESSIQNLQGEIERLNKMLLIAGDTKDVLAIENDKKRLKELDEMVKAVKHRQKYTESPNEIFDEIEIYLGTMDEDDSSDVSEEPTNIDRNLELTNVDLSPITSDETSIFDTIPEVEESAPIIEENPFSVEDVMSELPEITDEKEESERLKVVHVEPVDEAEKMETEENPFIIADYKDDDYIDVESLLNQDGVS